MNPKTEKTTEPSQNNMFITTLADLRTGRSVNELSEELQKLVAAVRATGKEGSITYKLHIKPASKGKVEALILADEIKLNLPQLDREAAIFFSTEDNRLQRRDPRQREFALKTVEGGKEEEPSKDAAQSAS